MLHAEGDLDLVVALFLHHEGLLLHRQHILLRSVCEYVRVRLHACRGSTQRSQLLARTDAAAKAAPTHYNTHAL